MTLAYWIQILSVLALISIPGCSESHRPDPDPVVEWLDNNYGMSGWVAVHRSPTVQLTEIRQAELETLREWLETIGADEALVSKDLRNEIRDEFERLQSSPADLACRVQFRVDSDKGEQGERELIFLAGPNGTITVVDPAPDKDPLFFAEIARALMDPK